MIDSTQDTQDAVDEGSVDDRSARRPVVITVIVLAAILGGLFLWRMVRTAPPPPMQPPPTLVIATRVQPQEVPVDLDAIGTLRAVREVELAPELAGRVTAIRFTSGSYVGSGAVLVQLNDAPEQAARRAAQARSVLARTQFERSEGLASLGAESQDVLQQRRAERDQASAGISQLDAVIRQKQVRAPFSGQIGIRRVNLGQYLNPGDVVATLTALDTLYVEFTVPQQALSSIRVGGTVQVSSDAFPGRTFVARVNAIEPQIAEETRNVAVQAQLPNPGGLLRPGMYVDAALALPPLPNGLLLPLTAVQTSAQGDSVVVIRGPSATKEGTAEIVPVRTGLRTGNNVVITSGLKPGDVVVTEGQLRIQPNAKLKVKRLTAVQAR